MSGSKSSIVRAKLREMLPLTVSRVKLALLLFLLVSDHLLATCKPQNRIDSSISSSSTSISTSTSREITLHYVIAEEQEVGSIVGNVSADVREIVDTAILPAAAAVASSSPATAALPAQLRYQFLSPAPRGFAIGDTSGVIVTTERLDRETHCLSHQVTGKVGGGGAAACTVHAELALRNTLTSRVTIVRISITIDDVNDWPPVFAEPASVTLYISEAAAVGSRYPLPQAVDRDAGKLALIKYTLDLLPGNVFGLRVERGDGSYKNNNDFAAATGGVSLAIMQPLDREHVSTYSGYVIAEDASNWLAVQLLPKSLLNLTVVVTDVNDNVPQFAEGLVNISIVEGVLQADNISEQLLYRFLATDPDEGLNGEVRFQFDSSVDKHVQEYFHLDSTTGTLWLQRDLDYEQHRDFLLKVVASDKGATVVQSSTATVWVTVGDINDNAPTITISALASSDVDNVTVIWVAENTSPETFVAQVTVHDLDPGGKDSVTCSINGDDGPFVFVKRHPLKYHLLVSPTSLPLDRELREQYDIIITCSDAADSDWSSSSRHSHANTSLLAMTSERRVKVMVTDENDHAPVFTADHYVATVIENNFEDSLILEVTATDGDTGANAQLHYYLQQEDPASQWLRLDPLTGLLTAAARFDRERNASFRFAVFVQDGGSPALTSSATVTLNVLDVNDERPHFEPTASYCFSVAEDAEVGRVIGQVVARDSDGGSGGYVTLALSLAGESAGTFAISRQSGHVTLLRPLDREKRGLYTFVAIATDGASPPLSSTAQITVVVTDVNDHAPVFHFPTGQSDDVIVIREPVVAGAMVTRVAAADDDVDMNGVVEFSILSGNADGLFSLHHATGLLTATRDLDAASNGRDIFLRLLAEDRGQPERLRAQTHLIIHVRIAAQSPLGFLSRTFSALLGGSQSETADATTTTNAAAAATLTFASCVGVAILATCLSVVVLCSLRRHRDEQSGSRSRSSWCTWWAELCRRSRRRGNTPKSESRVTLPNSVSYVKSEILDDYY